MEWRGKKSNHYSWILQSALHRKETPRRNKKFQQGYCGWVEV